VDKIVGADPPKLRAKFNAHISSTTSAPTTQQPNTEADLNKRLEALINQAPVMAFIKGTPDAPQCGFSAKFCKMMKEEGIEFSTFDILTDPQVRAGLKTYSNWPTFPQLYVKGKLVGGLDIVAEMVAEGELKELLEE